MSKAGNARIRRAVFMAALAASRYNPMLRPFYARLRARGKKPRVALVAVARKLLALMMTLLVRERGFDPDWATHRHATSHLGGSSSTDRMSLRSTLTPITTTGMMRGFVRIARRRSPRRRAAAARVMPQPGHGRRIIALIRQRRGPRSTRDPARAQRARRQYRARRPAAPVGSSRMPLPKTIVSPGDHPPRRGRPCASGIFFVAIWMMSMIDQMPQPPRVRSLTTPRPV